MWRITWKPQSCSGLIPEAQHRQRDTEFRHPALGIAPDGAVPDGVPVLVALVVVVQQGVALHPGRGQIWNT